MIIAKVGFEEIFNSANAKMATIDDEINAKLAELRAKLEEEARHDKEILAGVIAAVSEEVEPEVEENDAIAEEENKEETVEPEETIEEQVAEEIATFQA